MNAEKLIAAVEASGGFVTGLDGFVVFWPEKSNGGYSSWMLRAIADELDRRNGPLQAELEAYFKND